MSDRGFSADHLFDDLPLPTLNYTPSSGIGAGTVRFDAGSPVAPAAPQAASVQGGGWYNGASIANATAAPDPSGLSGMPYTIDVPFLDGTSGRVTIDPDLPKFNMETYNAGLQAFGQSMQAASSPSSGAAPGPNCATVLPDGRTIGQVVQKSIANIQNAAGPFDLAGMGTLGAFIATVQPHGPIDFKNTPMQGPGLGDAGNFTYGAIASGLGYPQSFAEMGAGLGYAIPHIKPGWHPWFEDNSAARNLPAGYANPGCTKP